MKYARLSLIVTLVIFLFAAAPLSAQEESICEEGDIKCFVDQIPATDPALLADNQQDDAFRLGIQMMIGLVGAVTSAYAFIYIRRKNKEDSSSKGQEDPLKKALKLDP
jgi:hypothetical protein